MNQEQIYNILLKLSNSKFRSSFKLKEKDIKYIKEKGIDTIKKHTYDFINKRLSPAIIINDGKQTPYSGHPTFVAQHATATCCRSCLYKWYHIKPNKQLSKTEQEYIVDIIITWIKNQIEINNNQ